MTLSSPSTTLDGAEISSVTSLMRPALVRYFRRRCNDAMEAEDLAQDVLMRTLLQTAGKSAEEVRGYIFRAAVNRWKDRRRRTLVRGITVEWSDTANQRAVESTSPERELAGRQELFRVFAALMELSERTRDVFVLVRLEQMGHKAVADMFGISVSAVNKHVAKALAHVDRRVGRLYRGL